MIEEMEETTECCGTTKILSVLAAEILKGSTTRMIYFNYSVVIVNVCLIYSQKVTNSEKL